MSMLSQSDIEIITHLLYKHGDEIAVSIARSFERLEERIDAFESRMLRSVSDLSDKVSTTEQNLVDEFVSLRDDLREKFAGELR